tara:strand:+ start:35 stop:508 length:474 start_codon:yes stop_codon:yes gene_type:complete
MYSISEINTNPIFKPPFFMLNGIEEHPTATMIKNIDMRREYIKVRKSSFTWFRKYNMFGTDAMGCLSWQCCRNGDIIPQPYQTPTASGSLYHPVWIRKVVKNGIEILGMKPSKKTTDGKFKYEGISMKDLKKYCRDNGLKKYSSKSKLELVKMLLSI